MKQRGTNKSPPSFYDVNTASYRPQQRDRSSSRSPISDHSSHAADDADAVPNRSRRKLAKKLKKTWLFFMGILLLVVVVFFAWTVTSSPGDRVSSSDSDEVISGDRDELSAESTHQSKPSSTADRNKRLTKTQHGVIFSLLPSTSFQQGEGKLQHPGFQNAKDNLLKNDAKHSIKSMHFSPESFLSSSVFSASTPTAATSWRDRIKMVSQLGEELARHTEALSNEEAIFILKHARTTNSLVTVVWRAVVEMIKLGLHNDVKVTRLHSPFYKKMFDDSGEAAQILDAMNGGERLMLGDAIGNILLKRLPDYYFITDQPAMHEACLMMGVATLEKYVLGSQESLSVEKYQLRQDAKLNIGAALEEAIALRPVEPALRFAYAVWTALTMERFDVSAARHLGECRITPDHTATSFMSDPSSFHIGGILSISADEYGPWCRVLKAYVQAKNASGLVAAGNGHQQAGSLLNSARETGLQGMRGLRPSIACAQNAASVSGPLSLSLPTGHRKSDDRATPKPKLDSVAYLENLGDATVRTQTQAVLGEASGLLVGELSTGFLSGTESDNASSLSTTLGLHFGSHGLSVAARRLIVAKMLEVLKDSPDPAAGEQRERFLSSGCS